MITKYVPGIKSHTGRPGNLQRFQKAVTMKKAPTNMIEAYC